MAPNKILQRFVMLGALMYITSVNSLTCYYCTSLQNPFCETHPIEMIECPKHTNSCMKFIVEGEEYDEKLEDTYTTVTVLRNCYNNETRFGQPSVCEYIPDVKYDIHICLCETDLCNCTTTKSFNIVLLMCTCILFNYGR